jgi:hypothetical protein
MSYLQTYVQDAVRTEAIPMMTHAEFVERSDSNDEEIRLAAIAGTVRIRLLHSALGMASEIGEYIEADNKNDHINLIEELGDMMWYWAIAVDALGLHPDRVYRQGEMALAPVASTTKKAVENDLFSTIGDWCDIVKKHTFYNRVLDIQVAHSFLALICRHICDLHILANRQTFEKTLERNIAKLRARYPEKFTTECALERDLTTERAILEGETEAK